MPPFLRPHGPLYLDSITMPRAAAQPWERQLVKATRGRGWTLVLQRGGRTQITRRWSDDTRSSVTVSTRWAPSRSGVVFWPAGVER
ncbi:hypothetical protein KBY83_13830 [Cyanobium sp. WKJ7-Wakatipu]|uniref:hypothetical protein n=1 Tax=Cyanobium sp. WKJ7-Wakatipu TaxID=2823726 RepID=UPI0020CC9B53|nr:hypothetical protein [Cyanobium sp. WKJ7-Wakatipu]MCP9784376.1 hypothetical protein [Cyanobium sp. WKJ7-Wakatipu]